jgi:hypothetical protein
MENGGEGNAVIAFALCPVDSGPVLDCLEDSWICLLHAWLASVFSDLKYRVKLLSLPCTLPALQLRVLQSQVLPSRVSLKQPALWSVVLPYVSEAHMKTQFLCVHITHPPTHTSSFSFIKK